MARASTNEHIKSTELAVAGAAVMISVGLLGIILSFTFRVAPSTIFGWIFIAGGFAYLAYTFTEWNDAEVLWRLLTGFVYLFAGLYVLLLASGIQLQHVTILTGSIVLVESLTELFIFSGVRPNEGSGWIRAGAIATILLAFIICCLWPLGSMRLVGGIVGVKFVISGLSRLMYSIATRKKLMASAYPGGLSASQWD